MVGPWRAGATTGVVGWDGDMPHQVFDHARHDGGGLGRATIFSRKDSDSPCPHTVVRSYMHCLLIRDSLIGRGHAP